MTMAAHPLFDKPLLVYVPCYNCEEHVAETIAGISERFHDRIECLVVDNRSEDRTAEIVRGLVEGRLHPFRITLVMPSMNLGYAGSQKLAYSLALCSPAVDRVIMLHGDGQYPSECLDQLLPHAEGEEAIINGYRDRKAFPGREETPPFTYAMIKAMSWLENRVTGLRQKEWHTGFVMYRADFLRRLPLPELSTTPHIDGEFLMCAGVLGAKTASVPIFKRYKEHEAFGGTARIRHVLDSLRIMFRYRRGWFHQLLEQHPPRPFETPYEILARG